MRHVLVLLAPLFFFFSSPSSPSLVLGGEKHVCISFTEGVLSGEISCDLPFCVFSMSLLCPFCTPLCVEVLSEFSVPGTCSHILFLDLDKLSISHWKLLAPLVICLTRPVPRGASRSSCQFQSTKGQLTTLLSGPVPHL